MPLEEEKRMRTVDCPSIGHSICGIIDRCLSERRRFCLLFWFLLASVDGSSQAQSGSDVNTPVERATYVDQLTAENEAAKAEAELWAIQHDMRVYDNDGHHTRELMGLLDGRPLYYTTENVQSAASVATDRVRNVALWDLTGTGWAVGVWDAAGVRASHQEFVGPDGKPRVKVRDSVITSAHSTHVAGTIGAAGVDPNAIGMAPGARIESYDWNNDTAQMFSRAANGPGQSNSIYVSNHSYGYVVGWVYYASAAMTDHVGWHYTGNWAGRNSYDNWFGQYNTIARQWDDVASQNSYYLAFAAAGNDRNDGPEIGDTVYYYLSGWHEITYRLDTCPPGDGDFNDGYDTISGPAVAKNIVTVGAVHQALEDGVRSCVKTAMTDFSCWGPTDDGRIKPDIVASGVDVYSCDHDSDQDYDTYSGTSMASPAAAGSAILLVEHYTRLFPGQAMRSSTLKGLILHTADDLGRVGPDYQCGWGLMNTRAAAELIQEDHDCLIGDLILEGRLDAQNPSDVYYLHTDGTSPIRITLCWTDPPAAAINSVMADPSPRLVNDLDLRLVGPGGSPAYCPYVLDPADPSAQARTGDNQVDNVEQVYLASPGQAGVYEVRVNFKNKTLVNGGQRYSLVSSQPLVNQRAPVAEDGQTIVSKNKPATITLKAADEGLPQTPGRLAYTIVSLPKHGTLAYANGTAITQPTTLAQYAAQVVYKPAADFLGKDSFTFSAADGGVSPFGGVSDTATVTLSVQDVVTLQYQVCTGEDDGIFMSGWQTTSGTFLRTGEYTSAMRFQGVGVPRGARIVSAALQVCMDATWTAESQGFVSAEATGDAKDFSMMSPRIYNRPQTQTSVAWDWNGNVQRYQWYASPNIAVVIQEVIDRSDWSAGNDLVVMYAGKEFSDLRVDFCSWEADPARAPKLEIVFIANPLTDDPTAAPEPGRTAPTVANVNLYANANTPVLVVLSAADDGLPGPLDFAIDSLPAHGSLEYPSGVAITQPGTLSGHVDRVIYRPAMDFTGDDAFRFHAHDGGTSPLGGSSNVAAVSLRVRNMVTRQYEVIVPEDDAYGADGSPVVLSDLLSVGKYDCVMRFRNVDILPASEVIGACLKVSTAVPTLSTGMNGVLGAQAAGWADDLTTPGLRISSLAKTQASAAWTWQAGSCGPVGTFHSSPDISGVVQEVVDRPDWLIDNSLAILYSGDRAAGHDVQFHACDSPYSTRAARLEVTCGLLESEILPPTVNQTSPVAEEAVTETPFNTNVTVTLSAMDDGLPDPPGRLTHVIVSLPSHGTLLDSQGELITEPGVLPDFSNRVVYRPATNFMGSDSFAFYADDGAVPASSGESNIATIRVLVRPPLTPKLTCSSYVKASEDDAYASRQDASNNYAQPTLLVGLNSSGFRFTNIDIPRGSKILSARMTVQASMEWLPQTVAGIIQAEAVGDAAGFSQHDRLVGSLPLTDAFVDWIWPYGAYEGWWFSTTSVCASPDISRVIQEVIDRPDWDAGNAIALVLWSQNIPYSELQILGYDNAPAAAASMAPVLSISYAPSDPEALDDADEEQPEVPANATTCRFQVGGERDDASASGGMNDAFGECLKVGRAKMSAMRFTGVAIPQGSTIVAAQLKIVVPSMQLADQLDGLLQAEAAGNVADYITDSRYLYDRTRTDASVAWIWEPGFYGSQLWTISPDIRDVVQEVVSRQDWSAGNAISILFSCTNQPSQDLQFLACGYCNDDPYYCSPDRYLPAVLEVNYVP